MLHVRRIAFWLSTYHQLVYCFMPMLDGCVHVCNKFLCMHGTHIWCAVGHLAAAPITAVAFVGKLLNARTVSEDMADEDTP